MTGLRVGVFLLAAGFPEVTDAETVRRTIATAVAAEAAGFDDVWVAEHHFMSYGRCPSAITLAGYLLGATSRVRVGTAVSVLPTQHPVALAEQTLLLDQASRGRFVLGIGRGGPWVDLEVFGTGVRAYQDDFGESLAVLLAALEGGTVSGSGPSHHFRPVSMAPRPYTRPRPPVVLAATSMSSVELAARHRLPVLLGMHADDAEKAALLDRYSELAPEPVDGHLSAGVGYLGQDAAVTMRECLPRWLRPGLAGYRTVDGRPRRQRDPYAYAAMLCRLHPVGSAQRCVRVLTETVRRTGVRRLMLMVEGAGDTERTLANVAGFGAEVLPRLRAATASVDC